tara:strand:- start:356 stop:976 length:621 start_codon:yes stop_codon:yes gene_type:complete
MRTLIKLCGFKNINDITYAASLDIDYLGMIFVQNLPRSITLDTAIKAVQICKDNNIKSVGVFLNQDITMIEQLLENVDLDVLQLHGNENIDDYRKFNKDIIKTIHICDDINLKIDNLDFAKSDYLLDTSSKNLNGGTGQTFNWDILKGISTEKLFIAGGLKTDNIIDLLKISRPRCVDVSSGIEKIIGSKDHNLMSEFVQKIRDYK